MVSHDLRTTLCDSATFAAESQFLGFAGQSPEGGVAEVAAPAFPYTLEQVHDPDLPWDRTGDENNLV
ncbi:hypothetical protein [Thermosynechococcus sp.]|uniref:hypothetical protein n=1 Tax=Thermosynechococcus sp. TaxID=2814275 RepID=UPI00391B067F